VKKDAENSQEEKPRPTAKKRKSASRILFRGLVYSLFFFLLLIASAGIVLEYFFPAEEMRVLAEKEGAKQLNLPLSIKKIKFSLLSGVRIDGVTLGPGVQPIVFLKVLIFDYDLSKLLQGKSSFTRFLLTNPN